MTIVVPFAPGGQADLAARPVSLGLVKILEQSVVVDNRAGAGGAIGAVDVAKAEPDGHTMLMALSAIAVLPEAQRVAGRKPTNEIRSSRRLPACSAIPICSSCRLPRRTRR